MRRAREQIRACKREDWEIPATRTKTKNPQEREFSSQKKMTKGMT
jgi:hypothetical protein